LQRAGLQVDKVDSASARFAQLQRDAPALADDFLLVATIVALFAGGVSTLASLGATSRQRSTELTALEVAGVSRGALARSLGLESGILAVTAGFGAGAGVLAAIMAIPALPELTTATPVPLRYGLPGGWLAAVSAAVMGIILIATVAVAALVLRRMSPLLLRMAPDDSAG
jgi:ABC-type antimicrobial peptide transport system permease subunit